MDHLCTLERQLRRDIALETDKEALDDGAIFRLVDEMQTVTRPSGVAHIPVKITQGARMNEALQGAVQLPQRTAQIVHQRLGAPDLGQRRARQPACHPQRMGLALFLFDRGQYLPRQARFQARYGERRISLGQMLQERCLEFAFNARFTGIHDFQNPVSRSIARLQPEIAITLAVERRGTRRHPEMKLGQHFSLLRRKIGGGIRNIGHGRHFTG